MTRLRSRTVSTINYSKTPRAARYAFTFWAFPRADYARNLRDYVAWAADYHRRTGFRCNLPLGSYFIRKDRSSLLSYTWDGDMMSLDPIHAPVIGRRVGSRPALAGTPSFHFHSSSNAWKK